MRGRPTLIERDEYITPFGDTFLLTAPPRRNVVGEEGTGMPPIDYITQRGPFQHGESLLDYYLLPRIVQVAVRHNFCDRTDYWDGRAALLAAVKPNAQVIGELSTGHLRKYYANGDIRQLDCIIDRGPLFQPQQNNQWDAWSFEEVLRFIAHNPIYYHPTQQSLVFTTRVDDLTFPATFPILFGTWSVSQNISYTGSWLEYPTIVIHGPVTSPTVTNVTTGETLQLVTTLDSTQSATFTLTYGTKTIVRNDGVNLIGYLSSDSDLTSFHLEPAPGAASGVNAIRVDATGTGAETSVTLSWYRRYIGL